MKDGIIASLGVGDSSKLKITKIIISQGRRRRLAAAGISVEFELTVEHPEQAHEQAQAAVGAVSDPGFADKMVKNVQTKIAESPALSDNFGI